MNRLIKKFLPRGIAIVTLAALYSLTKLPQLSDNERRRLSSQFSFVEEPLYEPSGVEPKYVRNVHPQYEKISAWISSVGAAVTITDIDGNGFCNDIVHVDPRYDKVLISPAAGTIANYEPFELMPKRLAYEKLTMAPMGTLAWDFNQDGQQDILVYYWGRSPIIFYKNDSLFEEAELNPLMPKWFSNAATIADFDGDGHPDILITNYFSDGSSVLDANAKDYNQTMQHSMSRAWNGGDNHFYLFEHMTNGYPKYIEHSEWKKDVEHPEDWTLAVAAADINGDMLPEIYLANDFGPDKLLYNLSKPGELHFMQLKGVRRFTDIRSSVLGKDSFKGMGVCFTDINNDGLLDIYVSNIAAKYALEESHFVFINTGQFEKMKEGIAPFYNESESLGLSRSSWGWDAKLADFNNDGVPEALQAVGFIKGEKNKWAELQELAIGNDELLANTSVWPDFRPGTDLSGKSYNPFFVRSKSGRYFDIASDVGLGNINICRGIAISDVDRDGDQDFVTANQWEPSFLWRNNYNGTNKFLGVRFMFSPMVADSIVVNPAQEFKQLRFAAGTYAKLLLPGGKSIPAFVDGGNGHSGKNSNEIFFGLGTSVSNQRNILEIKWRNSKGEVRQETIELNKGWHTIILPF